MNEDFRRERDHYLYRPLPVANDGERAPAGAGQPIKNQEEEHLEWQALRSRRTKWLWLAQSPSLAGPLFWIGLSTDSPLPEVFFLRFGLHIFIPAALGWIGYCTATIAALHGAISGIPASILQRTGIFLGLLLMNAFIGGSLFFVGCVIFVAGH